MSTLTIPRATLDDLYRVEGKAELINGRIVPMASRHLPSTVAGNIFVDLRIHTKKTKKGRAYADGAGFAVSEMPSGRESFAPDTSYYDGPLPASFMRFIEGPPTCAIEVRSENDYGDGAEELLAAKRTDYFLAGTLAVWDVDPQAETIRLYLASSPSEPTLFRRGEVAHAEPAVPGWRMSVDEVFAR
ncbi:MAG: Uma2 family endonuclease [Gemmataceae bacterium]|nr:Uma2 family endonuclease [Gemmataceae bacterium]